MKVGSRAGPLASQFEQTVEREGASHVHIGEPRRGRPVQRPQTGNISGAFETGGPWDQTGVGEEQ